MKTLKKSLLFLVVGGLGLGIYFSLKSSSVAGPEFSEELCKNTESIARELIQAELFGQRWQGGDSPCLNQSKFKAIRVQKNQYGDPGLLDPEFEVDGISEIKITKIEQDSVTRHFTAHFAYIGKSIRNPKKTEQVRDSIEFRLWRPKLIAGEGCAGLLREPDHFVMQKGCFSQ